MGRSLSLAVAVTLLLLGLECLVVKRATLSMAEPPQAAEASTDYSFIDPSLAASTPIEGKKRVIEPPEWAPFMLLSAGVVLLLYTKASAA